MHRIHRPDERWKVGDEILRQTTAPQELLGNFALGLVERIDADGAWSDVFNRFQTLGLRKVNGNEDRDTHPGTFNADFLQIGAAQVGPDQVGPVLNLRFPRTVDGSTRLGLPIPTVHFSLLPGPPL